MTKLIAKLALMVILIALGLGNFWFTYGIWPRSWWSFAFFGVMSVLVMALSIAVDRDTE